MTPLSDDEIRDLLTTTLHGNPPRAMMHRMFATLADVSTLRAEVERLREHRRSFICGWCLERVYQYPNDTPQDDDHEAALAVFEEHDRTCPKNPLVAKIERLTRLARNVINAWDAGADGVVVAEIAIAELRAEIEREAGE